MTAQRWILLYTLIGHAIGVAAFFLYPNAIGFCACAATGVLVDATDGALARRFQCTSVSGAIADRVGDCVVAQCYAYLCAQQWGASYLAIGAVLAVAQVVAADAFLKFSGRFAATTAAAIGVLAL